MVRRALSLRRGSALSLEIETGSNTTSSRTFSLPGSEILIAQNQTQPVGDNDSMPTGSNQNPRQRHGGGRLPLSRHHQNIRKKSSMTSINAGNNTVSTTAPPARNKNRIRTRTNSSSTSVSLTSTNSTNSSISLDELDASPVLNRAGGLSSMLDDGLAVILDDEYRDDGSDSGPDRLGGLRSSSRTRACSGKLLMAIGEDVRGI
ncbi:hypothetical protein V8F06_014311 [Rhypophila decipiens]